MDRQRPREKLRIWKRFIPRLIIFGVGFLAVSYPLNSLYVSLLLKNSVEETTEDQFRHYGWQARILVFGDSHSKRAFDPAVLRDSFDYASFGESYLQTFHKAKDALAATEAEIVVLPVDLHSFSSFRVHRVPFAFYWRRHMPLMRLAADTHDPGFAIDWLRGNFFAYVMNREMTIDAVSVLTGLKAKPEVTAGYAPGVRTLAGRPREAVLHAASARARMHFGASQTFDEELLDYFDRTLELCDRLGKKVILVSLPVSHEYYDQAVQYVGREQVLQIALSTARRHESYVDYLDFTETFFDRDDMFEDEDHLSRDGARAFSALFAEELAERLGTSPWQRNLRTGSR